MQYFRFGDATYIISASRQNNYPRFAKRAIQRVLLETKEMSPVCYATRFAIHLTYFTNRSTLIESTRIFEDTEQIQ